MNYMIFYYFLDRVPFHRDFRHIFVTIIGIFMVIIFILNYTFRLSVTRYFWFCKCATLWIFPSWAIPWILDWTCYLQKPLFHAYNPYQDMLNVSTRLCNWFSLRWMVPRINHLPPLCIFMSLIVLYILRRISVISFSINLVFISQSRSGLSTKLQQTPGPLFSKRTDVLPQDIVKSRSREIGCYNDRIALKFDSHLGSAAQSDWKSVNANLASSSLLDILH